MRHFPQFYPLAMLGGFLWATGVYLTSLGYSSVKLSSFFNIAVNDFATKILKKSAYYKTLVILGTQCPS